MVSWEIANSRLEKKFNDSALDKLIKSLPLEVLKSLISDRSRWFACYKYGVLQVVLIEKFLGTESGIASLTNLQAAINKQVSLGYSFIL